jgi:hypothetical protein
MARPLPYFSMLYAAYADHRPSRAVSDPVTALPGSNLEALIYNPTPNQGSAHQGGALYTSGLAEESKKS